MVVREWSGLMRLHEFEDPGGIEPVSRANQAAAFQDFALFTERGILAPQALQLEVAPAMLSSA
jgi:hypothetical protein